MLQKNFKIGAKVRIEVLVTPPKRMVVNAIPAMQLSSAPASVLAIRLFRILSAIRFSIPASFNTPMMPKTEITRAQVGRILLTPPGSHHPGLSEERLETQLPPHWVKHIWC